jgi:hypothetical protein
MKDILCSVLAEFSCYHHRYEQELYRAHTPCTLQILDTDICELWFSLDTIRFGHVNVGQSDD